MHWKARIDPIELKNSQLTMIKPSFTSRWSSEVRVIGGKEKNIGLSSIRVK
jgi:hypothetical protein